MLKNSFKSILAIATIAASAVFVTAPANAGSFSVHVGNGYGSGIHFSTGKKRYYNGGHKFKKHGSHFKKRHVKKHHVKKKYIKRVNGFHCTPRLALKKSFKLGMYEPHVARINHKSIVVKGFHKGYEAKIVYKRTNHKGCKIVKAFGI